MSMDFVFAVTEQRKDGGITLRYLSDGDEVICINMSNTNARDVAAKLGMIRDQHDEYEPVPISDFEERCKTMLRTMVGKPDAEKPPIVEEGNGCKFILCGRDEGYLQRRISSLLVLSRRARELGAEVALVV